MKNTILLIFCFVFSFHLSAQLAVHVTISPNQSRKSISPYIYGDNLFGAVDPMQNINQDSVRFIERSLHLGSRVFAGDIMSTYNWETNFANSGSGYINQSNDYVPWTVNVQDTFTYFYEPNVALKEFHKESLFQNTYSAIQLPCLDYLAKDSFVETVPNAAPDTNFWVKVEFRKPGAPASWSFTPNRKDYSVYIDECLNHLLHSPSTNFGLSNSARGIKGYFLDNEVAFWGAAHPLVHPLLHDGSADPEDRRIYTSKSIELASVIKEQDSTADVFGSVDGNYACSSIYNLYFSGANHYGDSVPLVNIDGAKTKYSDYSNWATAYCAQMRIASAIAGKRLVDVYDAHWYEYAVKDSDNVDDGSLSVNSGDTTDATRNQIRMQSVRSLYDSTYVEKSWITAYSTNNQPINYLNFLWKQINSEKDKDPERSINKLAVSEYSFGAENHISGSLATADALGAFGTNNIYLANIFAPLFSEFAQAPFKLFRNYDGNNSSFGSISHAATTDEIVDSNGYKYLSVYSSDNGDSNQLHVIVINKHTTKSIAGQFSLVNSPSFKEIKAYGYSYTNPKITLLDSQAISSSSFSYNLQPLSAYHMVLAKHVSTAIQIVTDDTPIAFYPNPTDHLLHISTADSKFQYEIRSLEGAIILKGKANNNSISLDLSNYSSGVYIVNVQTDTATKSQRIIRL